MKNSPKGLTVLALAVSLVIGLMLAGGCTGQEASPPSQEGEICPVSVDDPMQSGCRQNLYYSDFPDPYPKTTPLTPEEAFAVIQENQGNPDFVIIDLRAPAVFAEGHIENSVNLDYLSEDFQALLDKLDKGRTYLFFGKKDGYSANAANRMEEYILGDAIYYMSGGLDAWLAARLPVVR